MPPARLLRDEMASASLPPASEASRSHREALPPSRNEGPQGGGYVVLELNGAVDFDERYALAGEDPYALAARALGLTSARHLARAAGRR